MTLPWGSFSDFTSGSAWSFFLCSSHTTLSLSQAGSPFLSLSLPPTSPQSAQATRPGEFFPPPTPAPTCLPGTTPNPYMSAFFPVNTDIPLQQNHPFCLKMQMPRSHTRPTASESPRVWPRNLHLDKTSLAILFLLSSGSHCSIHISFERILYALLCPPLPPPHPAVGWQGPEAGIDTGPRYPFPSARHKPWHRAVPKQF